MKRKMHRWTLRNLTYQWVCADCGIAYWTSRERGPRGGYLTDVQDADGVVTIGLSGKRVAAWFKEHRCKEAS